MTAKQIIFLKLLRSALWNESTVRVDCNYSQEQYKSIINISIDHAVLGLVGDIVINKVEGGCPLSTKDGLETGYLILSIQKKHKLQQSVLDTINTRLIADGISPVLLKGEGLAQLYPNPYLRQCGDLDIYVGKKGFDKAIVSVDEIHDINTSTHYARKHYGCTVKDVEVELHRYADILSFRFKKDKAFQKFINKELSKEERTLKLSKSEIKLPTGYFDSIFILQHLWNHLITGGIGFKQICDWTMVLHHYSKDIDTNRLTADLKSFGLLNAWKYIGYIVVNYLGLPKEECPLYNEDNITVSNSEAILQLIFDDGNFGKRSSRKGDIGRPEGYMGSKIHSLRNNFSRLKNTLNFVEKEDRLAYYLEYLRSTTERLNTKR